jgi:phosphoheptose isomerase
MDKAFADRMSYLGGYLERLRDNAWWTEEGAREVERATLAIETCREMGGTVWACGNGGSWCTAAHFAGDLAKPPQGMPGKPTRAVCLGANPALMLATANDVSYDRIFADELLAIAPGINRVTDVFVGISASGNSRNVDLARCDAKAVNMITIGFTGFDGGVLKDRSDISIHIPVDHFGIVEDLHLVICHAIAYYMAGDKL